MCRCTVDPRLEGLHPGGMDLVADFRAAQACRLRCFCDRRRHHRLRRLQGLRQTLRDTPMKFEKGKAIGALNLLSDRVGAFTEARAIGLDLLEELGHKARQSEALLPVETALDDIPALAMTEAQADRLRQGQPVLLTRDAPPSGALVRAEVGSRLVALVRSDGVALQPVRVFNL